MSLIFFLLSLPVQPDMRDLQIPRCPPIPLPPIPLLFSDLQHFVLKLGGKALLVSMLLLVLDIPVR